MNSIDLKARRKARLKRPERHDCGVYSRVYLRLYWCDVGWFWFAEINGRLIRVFYCPWCGQALEESFGYEPNDSKDT